MAKATIHMKEHLIIQAKNAISNGYAKSMSNLIEIALQQHLKQLKEERIKKALEEASKDPLFLSDIKETGNAFKYIDYNEA